MKEANGALPAHAFRGKSLRRAILWGVVSLAAYLLVFLNQDAVTRYFTKGGIFAVVIVATALAFAIIHGTFANYILEVFGIEALKREKEDH